MKKRWLAAIGAGVAASVLIAPAALASTSMAMNGPNNGGPSWACTGPGNYTFCLWYDHPDNVLDTQNYGDPTQFVISATGTGLEEVNTDQCATWDATRLLVNLIKCSGVPSQQWSFPTATGGTGEFLKNAYITQHFGNKCVDSSQPESAGALFYSACGNNENQEWAWFGS